MALKFGFHAAIGLAVSSISCYASPMLTIGDNSAVIGRLGGQIQYSDNIFLDSANEESDIILVFSPGVELNVGTPTSNAYTNIVYLHDFVNYSDADSLNRDNANFALKGHSNSPKTKVNFSVNYREHTQNDAANNVVGDIARRDLFRSVIRSEWEKSAKSSLAAGIGLENVDYEAENLYDRESYNAPFDYYWEYSPKLDISTGYRYRRTSFDRDGDFAIANSRDPRSYSSHYKDHFLNLGVRGEISAKTRGEIKVGIQYRDFNSPGTSNRDMFAVDARVVWAPTVKTSGTLLISRDFRSDAFGTSIESSDFAFSASTKFREDYSGFALIRYSDDQYFSGRDDQGVFTQVGVSYTPNLHSTIRFAYVIYNNNSSFINADFENNLLSVSGSLRY